MTHFFHSGLHDRWTPERVDGWLSSSIVDAQPQIADRFAQSGGRVVVDALIDPFRARQIRIALEHAAFEPHHHAPYPLHIAPRRTLDSTLASYFDWLARPSTSRIFLGLVGMDTDVRLKQIQVQLSRMTENEFFPQHVDTDEPALAVITNFTEGFTREDGGALRFFDGSEVAPAFNSTTIFVTTQIPHEVTPVIKRDAPRFSATMFAVWHR